VVECDALGTGIGAILMQSRQLIAFFSKALLGRNLELYTYEKEMLALVAAVQKWCPYLLGQKFIFRTDPRSLKFLCSHIIAMKAQQKWLVKLMGYNFLQSTRRVVTIEPLMLCLINAMEISWLYLSLHPIRWNPLENKWR